MNSSPDIDAISFFGKVLSANSFATLVLLAVGFAIWIVGGNLLVIRHHRRLGKPWFASLNPLSFPFKNFNRAEWGTFLALLGSSMACLLIAVLLNEK